MKRDQFSHQLSSVAMWATCVTNSTKRLLSPVLTASAIKMIPFKEGGMSPSEVVPMHKKPGRNRVMEFSHLRPRRPAWFAIGATLRHG